MVTAAVREVAARRVAIDRLVGASVLSSFVWLLLTDRIPPLGIFLLELYLTL